MSNTQNIIESKKFIQSKKLESNQALLDIHDHLFMLEEEKIWQDESYYEGASEFAHLRKTEFWRFAKAAFGVKPATEQRLREIVQLENGRKLFLLYGYENMVVYLHNPTFREIILKIITTTKTKNNSSFYYILTHHVPDYKKPEGDKKYSALWSQVQNLRDKLQRAYARILHLREEKKGLEAEVKRLNIRVNALSSQLRKANSENDGMRKGFSTILNKYNGKEANQ